MRRYRMNIVSLHLSFVPTGRPSRVDNVHSHQRFKKSLFGCPQDLVPTTRSSMVSAFNPGTKSYVSRWNLHIAYSSDYYLSYLPLIYYKNLYFVIYLSFLFLLLTGFTYLLFGLIYNILVIPLYMSLLLLLFS